MASEVFCSAFDCAVHPHITSYITCPLSFTASEVFSESVAGALLPGDVKLHVFMLNSVSTGQDGLGALWSETVELLITIAGVAPTFDGTDYPQSGLNLTEQ